MTPSVPAASVHLRERIPVSVKALYDKLRHVELSTSRGLVQHTAKEVGELIDRLGGCRAALRPGDRVRILDGNHLRGTEHRLQVLRGTAAGALPGHTLVLLDPQRMVIDDRNFCTTQFLWGVSRRRARFITRQHAGLPWRPQGKRRGVHVRADAQSRTVVGSG